jgi:organic radical activating enzyme
MKLKAIVDEDFVNYKLPSMFIGFPNCNFKCEKECGMRVCQNSVLATSPSIAVNIDELVSRYMSNFITSAIVIAGLEPFDDFDELLELVKALRNCSDDNIVIYTGYYNYEILKMLQELYVYKNIIIKYGRYVPDQISHYDKVLGVYLASDNQYAVQIS